MHPDRKGAPYDILFGHEAPVATVVGVVAVIPHHEVMAFGHDHLAHLRAWVTGIVVDEMADFPQLLLKQQEQFILTLKKDSLGLKSFLIMII